MSSTSSAAPTNDAQMAEASRMATTLRLTPEKSALSASAEQATSVLATIVAAEASAGIRQPLELVAVVDRSGSMSGSKIQQMKETLSFLVSNGLTRTDRFAIVAFDNKVETRLSVTTMDNDGKKKALEAVANLQPGGATNLSGGLLQGIDLLSKQDPGSSGTNRAVLLFTDGIANNGIREPSEIVVAAQGAMTASPCTIFTFGFGADHQEDLLRNLAESTNGLYYFLEKSEDIPTAFADCLGGLVSVVAQNATLTLEGVDGTVLAEAHCPYKCEALDGGRLAISLGDLYSEDEKDIVLSVKLPQLPAPRPEAAVAVRASIRYFSVAASAIEEVGCTLQLSRPATTPVDQPANARLDEQRSRIDVAEAMRKASVLADSGQVSEGRDLIRAAVARAKQSPAGASPVVSGIVAEAERIEGKFVDRHVYRMEGQKMSKMSAMANMQQRSTHSSAAVYEKKSKVAMKNMFSSMSSAASSCCSSSAPASAPPLPPLPLPQMPTQQPMPMQQGPPTPGPPTPGPPSSSRRKMKMPTIRSFRNSSTDGS